MRALGIAATIVVLACGCAHAQDCGAGLADAVTVRGPHYALAFRTQPAKIAVGKHFTLAFRVCPTDGAPPPATVAVDAFMPEHQHGMNYKPAVKALGSGAFEASGLMLHMPGRWEFRFDIQRQGEAERLTSAYVLR